MIQSSVILFRFALVRFSGRNDANGFFIRLGVHNQKDIQVGTQAKCLESLFAVELVFNGQSVFIFESNHRISEVDAMFSQI